MVDMDSMLCKEENEDGGFILSHDCFLINFCHVRAEKAAFLLANRRLVVTLEYCSYNCVSQTRPSPLSL
jgi:hypothetical protein